jgi:hypothetical protein
MPKRKLLVWPAFVGGLLVAAVLVAVGYMVSPDDLDVGTELVKAGIELGAVAIVGSVIAYQVQRVQDTRTTIRSEETDAREDERRKAEYRARVFHEVVLAYNGVKCARRVLRANGFRKTASDRPMAADDAKEFNRRMRSLTNCQLLFEGVAREVRARDSWFSESDLLVNNLDVVANYVKNVLEDWERTDGEVTTGARLSRVHELRDLQAFLDDVDEGFGQQAKQPMKEIEQILREVAYPSPAGGAESSALTGGPGVGGARAVDHAEVVAAGETR